MAASNLLIHGPLVGFPSDVTEEEVPMTLQFGLVGTDGVVLAGDTRIYETGANARTAFNASKFGINQRRTIATAWSEKATGIYVANAIRRNMPDDCEDPKASLEQIAEEAWDKVEDKQDESRVLVALRKPYPQLFSLSLASGGVVVYAVVSKIVAGNSVNVATYFVERYYKQ